MDGRLVLTCVMGLVCSLLVPSCRETRETGYGPENGGLALRLAIDDAGTRDSGKVCITLVLRNTTKSAKVLVAQHSELKGPGDYADYVQANVSFVTVPRVLPRVAQTSSGRAIESLSEVIPPEGKCVVHWCAGLPYLKEELYKYSSPCFPVSGLYGVRAELIVALEDGQEVLLQSNEAPLMVGGDARLPRYPTATVLRTDSATGRAFLDIGVLHGVAKGDVYSVYGDAFEIWKLEIIMPERLFSTAQVTKVIGKRAGPVPPLQSLATLECP